MPQTEIGHLRAAKAVSHWNLLLLALLVFAANCRAETRTLNVPEFGARGDAVQFHVNTVSNSVVATTTNRLSSDDIGKAIEVLGAGTVTYGIDSHRNMTNGNQDIVAMITDVVNETNIHISQVSRATLTNTFATYGHDNTANFNACIAAAGTNSTINIPAGTYLFLSTNHTDDPTCWDCIRLKRGGLTFKGDGTNRTILLGQFAWKLQPKFGVKRGILFAEVPPVTNDYPVVLENMTLDGGVERGNTAIHGTSANRVDGQGWDGSHGGFDVRGFPGHTFSQMLWTNLIFTHWRGEMVKSNDGSTNGNLRIFNCVFSDGNATAINIYPSLNVSNCEFDNLFQVAEYYQKYSTNTSWFQDNLVTNISGNQFALNGGKGVNPPFVICGNTFYFSSMGRNGIETTPADNVFIISNRFICQNGVHVQNIVLGSAGYQGYFDNSNIVIAANTFVQPSMMVELGSQAPNDARSVQVFGNILILTNGFTMALQTYGWSTNIHYFSNDFSSKVTKGFVRFASGTHGGQYALVDTNNLYYSPIYDLTGKTNYVTYAAGSRFEVIYPFHKGTVYALSDSDSNQIPPGAQIIVINHNSSSAPIPVYLNSALTGAAAILGSNQTLRASWTNGAWRAVSH